MKLHRDPTEPEYLVALVAAQAVPAIVANSAPERPMDEVVEASVEYAERIVAKVVDRADQRELDEPGPTPLPPGALMVDEFGSRNREGGDERQGISVEWAKGTTLSHEDAQRLIARIIGVAEELADGIPGNVQVLYDVD